MSGATIELGGAGGGGSRPLLVSLMLAMATAALAVVLGMLLWRRPHFGPDFLVFWTAAQQPVSEVYAFKITPGAPMPLVYPPPFLLLLQGFSGVTARSAYLIWLGASVFAFVAASAVLVKRLAPLVMLAPPVVFASVTGETSLLLGALLIAGLGQLSRPTLAGILFGLALSLKPQVAFLLPIGLVAAGQWKALLATLATAAAVCAAAAITLGPSVWLAWLNVLPKFVAFEAQAHLQTVALAPQAGVGLRLAIITLAAALVWRAFQHEDLAVRLIAVIGLSMLCAPHAMAYDTTIIAPGALALVLRRSWTRIPALGFCLGVASGPITLAGFVILCGTGILSPLDARYPMPTVSLPRRADAARE